MSSGSFYLKNGFSNDMNLQKIIEKEESTNISDQKHSTFKYRISQSVILELGTFKDTFVFNFDNFTYTCKNSEAATGGVL